MTDRQTQAVAEAIYKVDTTGGIRGAMCPTPWPDLPKYAKKIWLNKAQAAIAASDAKHLPVIMETITKIRNEVFYFMTRNRINDKPTQQLLGSIKEELTELIAALPEDIRNG